MKSDTSSFQRPRSAHSDLLVAVVGVPAASCLLVGSGLALLTRYQQGELALSADLAVALLAAATGAALALWWLGGVTLALLAVLARSLRWRRLEQWAARRTPRILVRTVGAVAGIHLATMSTAHATEPVTPFWTETGTSTVQAEPDSTAEPSPDHREATGLTGADRATHPADLPEPSGPVFDAPTRAPDPVLPAQERVVDATLTVVRGDTLWGLTTQLLGPHADPSAVAAGTAAWVAHNNLPLGGNLIRPGDRLHIPPALLTANTPPSHQGATP